MQLNQNARAPSVKESGFSTVCGVEAKYIYEYYRLRAEVFRSELGWIGSQSDQIDIDPFDTNAVHFLTLSPNDKVIAALRLLPANQAWMMEEHFQSLMPTDSNIHTADACEISRLAIHKDWRNHEIKQDLVIAEILYKGVFQYCLANQIRYIYMVTTTALIGHLRKKGLPINVMSKQKMSDGVVALIAQLDWYAFINDNTSKNPARLAWYLNLSEVINRMKVS